MFKYRYHAGHIWTAREQRSEDRPPVTCFYIDPGAAFQKWITQNRGEYTGDYIEGVLQDSFVISTPRGYAAVYEHYLNCWSSDYYVEFQPGAAEDVWSAWYEFETAAETA